MISRSIQILFLFLFSLSFFASAQKQNVFVLEIKKEIGPAMSRYVELGLQEAEKKKADIIIIDMDTYGGALNDADKIRKLILDEEIPIYAFVNKNAASAGALISIACDRIYMTGGASIGAATVVNQEQQAAPDKYQSYMRSMMRSTAERNGRDPQIAEAMVDERLFIDGITEPGQVLTFTTSEAIQNNFCEGQVESIQDLLNKVGVKDYKSEIFYLSKADQVINYFLNPLISGLLILIVIGGLYFELQTPGVGFPLFASITALILYFVPYYLNGLAENWELILFFVGAVLILAELFFIPGFGIAGISGLVAVLAALGFMMIDNDGLNFDRVPGDQIYQSLMVVSAGLLTSIVLIIFGTPQFLKSKAFKKISLEIAMSKEDGYTTYGNEVSPLIGKIGISYTVLRPGGKIQIEGEIYDAETRGEFINRNESIIIIGKEGHLYKVKTYSV